MYHSTEWPGKSARHFDAPRSGGYACARMAPVETEPRHDWTTAEVEALYALPLTELVFRAQAVHRTCHDAASRGASKAEDSHGSRENSKQ